MSARLQLAVALFAITAAPLAAQSTPPAPPAVISPLRTDPDINGVNLLNGEKDVEMPVVLSAPGDPRLTFDKIQNWRPYIEGVSGSASQGEGTSWSYSIHTGQGTSESFTCDQEGGCTSVTHSGSELIGVTNYTRAPGGEVYVFNKFQSYTDFGLGASKLRRFASRIDYPDGQVISIFYDQGFYPGWTACTSAGSRNCQSNFRPTTINSSTGYYISISYAVPAADASVAGWGTPSSAELHGPGGPLIRRVVYNSNQTITDFGNDAGSPGRTYTSTVANSLGYAGSGADVEQAEASITLPGEAAPHLTITRASTNFGSILYSLIGSINRDGVTWTYTYANPHHPTDISQDIVYDSVTVSGPNGYQVVYDMFRQGDSGAPVPLRNQIKQRTDALGHVTKYAYGLGGRLTGVTMPELNSVGVTYDDCGNVTSRTTHAKSGSGVLTELAHYPDLSTPLETCPETRSYRPDSSTDANGKVTTYTFSTKGQLTDQLDPADASGVVRHTHSDYSPTGLSQLTSRQVCNNALACSSNYVTRTDYSYSGNTFLPATVTQYDLATGSTRPTTYRYDPAGRAAMIDGPLPAPAHDEKYFQYDLYGRKIWEVGELAPNGLRLAKKYLYRDSDDKVWRVNVGTVNCLDNCDTAALTLTAINTTDTTYDSRRYPIRELVRKSTNNYIVTDRSFLDRGLAECTAVRMNVSAPVAQGAACTPDSRQNVDGLDRITKNNYDAAGQLSVVQKAFGTPEQVDYTTYSYTPNGKQEYVTDANGNKARFVYDGFDRLFQWQFPSKTTPGTVNTADFEQYLYDNNGNRASLKKRDGSTLTYTYDNLNRMTLKVVPSRADLTPAQTRDVYFGYDLAGRQLYARFDSAAGPDGVTNTYNGFGDLLTSQLVMATYNKTLTSTYDVAGRRTKLTHPDGQAFTYAYDDLSRLSGVYEGVGTGTPLDTFTYATNGLVSARSEGSGASGVTYGWDDVSRLASQSDTFAGGTNNVGWSFVYNGASQITSETRTNDAFASLTPATGTTAYVPNGLNQYSSVGGTTQIYDDNGNLTGDGTKTYTYDIENRLVKAVAGSTATNVVYDPLGRLFEFNQGNTSNTRRFVTDGDAIVNELNGSNALAERFVHGSNAAADDPLLWYANANAGLASKQWLHSDHLGSIVARTASDGSGGNPVINKYDEYGTPATTNGGRFQYTGQVWISQLGLYYYKARFYSPGLGRFMQTDPLGYLDQMNLYGYVHSNPTNAFDYDGERTTFIGGFNDENSEIVKTYAFNFARSHRSETVNYFPYYKWKEAAAVVSAPLNKGERNVLIGHSWGGANAIAAATLSRQRIDRLITIDPIGLPPAVPLGGTMKPQNVLFWSYVQAAPSKPNLSDFIAFVGGGNTIPTGADEFFTEDANHEDFARMMNRSGNTAKIEQSFGIEELGGRLTGSRGCNSRIEQTTC